MSRQLKKIRLCHVSLARGYRGGERQALLTISESTKKNGYSTLSVTRKNNKLNQLVKLLTKVSNLSVSNLLEGHFSKTISNVSLIHAHDGKAVYWAFIHKLLFNTPYIITRRVDHDLNDRLLTRLAYRKAAKVVAISTAIKKSLESFGLKKIPVIPSCSDFFPEEVKSKPFDPTDIKLFMAGALVDHHKGQSIAIKALAKLPREYSLTIYGDGPDKEKLNKLISDLSLNQRVKIMPWEHDFNKLNGIFDGFLMPSLHEGLGSILIDIMRLGIPVIASKVGGIPDLVKNNETGYLITCNNVEELAKKIELCLVDPNLELIVNNAYECSLSLTPDKMFQQYLKVYDQALKQ